MVIAGVMFRNFLPDGHQSGNASKKIQLKTRIYITFGQKEGVGVWEIL